MRCLLFLALTLFSWLPTPEMCANSNGDFPVLYQGRFRPAEAYARFWLYERYHAPNLKTQDLTAFHTTSSSALSFLWSIEFQGHLPYQSAPLFWIGSAKLKELASLPLSQNRFSLLEIAPQTESAHQLLELLKPNNKLSNDWQTLINTLKAFTNLNGSESPIEVAFAKRLTALQSQGIAPNEIDGVLEREFPIAERLRQASSLFKSLPGRFPSGEWFSIAALRIQRYDPSSNTLKPIGNFTLYADEDFIGIRSAYYSLADSIANHSEPTTIQHQKDQLAQLLLQAYRPLAGKVYQQAHGKSLSYPTIGQLKTETAYVSYPWIHFLIFLYGISACLLIASFRLSSCRRWAVGVIIFALLCHTTLLAARCYILGRPPVANMFETVIYVPWVAACTALLFPMFRRNPYVLLAACLSSIILLLILEVTHLNQSLEQVQAVLDSQFWLLIHVLLVVGSYGIFFLGGVLGHFYLGLYLMNKKETGTMTTLARLILQTMYGGTILLVSGTILGGVWAAESWGRFWDWDPKESWAFISSCFYLLWIHAFRFHRIASFGLAFGAVSGLLAISFTWYGVNYILGTGLHSYGFGSGGEIYYYTFFAAECLFLTLMLWLHFKIENAEISVR